MSDSEPTLLSVITDVTSGVPAPVRVSIYKAFSDLLGGLVSIPAAKLKQYTQSIDDTTAARSIMAKALAHSAADIASKDPQMLIAAGEVYQPSILRRMNNTIQVAQSAAEHLAKSAESHNGEGTAAPEQDWMNRFIRFAEDASSERMQDLFGRILAGEVLRPGAFGLATLRILSELDQDIANDFTDAWSKTVGDAVDYSSYWYRGEGFMKWKRLSEAGLMAPSSATQFLPPYNPNLNGLSLWSPIHIDGIGLLVHFTPEASAGWTYVKFTRVGRELGSILTKPDYEKNIRAVADRLPREGIYQIDFIRDNCPDELIWVSQATN